jgi:Family of unknown function (DUF6165)
LPRKAKAKTEAYGVLVPVSWGELIDKITILEIKAERIKRREALAHVRHELGALNAVMVRAPRRAGLARLKTALRKVNLALWEIEDEIRLKERAGNFDAGFINLARSVYQTNDRRGALKRRINDLLGSEVVEEKHYARY